MDKKTYDLIESKMLEEMDGCDFSHDSEHVYRVLSMALVIGENYEADMDILITAALLHDIGRNKEFENPEKDHAAEGAKMAEEFLLSIGFDSDKICQIRKAIASHRFKKENPPQSIEAKILYDADKLDLTGTMAVIRGILAGAAYGEPVYVYDKSGNISDGDAEGEISFMGFYHSRLKKVSDNLFTPEAKEIAEKRFFSTEAFYNSMKDEIIAARALGKSMLDKNLE